MTATRTYAVRTLILAAGDGTRWDLHTGVPKHLVDVEGETLLYRTVRQFAELGDVEIVAPADHRYVHPRARTSPARLDPANGDADRFASSLHRWDSAATMVLVFGDVWYSAAAVSATANLARGDLWSWVARFGPSPLTGKANGEGFAFVVPPYFHEVFRAALWALIALPDARKLGWDLYRLLDGLPPGEHRQGPHLTEVDDWTDDFDFPHDFDTWVANRRRAGAVGEP